MEVLAGVVLNGLGVATAIAGFFVRGEPRGACLPPLMLNMAPPVIIMGLFNLGVIETISVVGCFFAYWLLIRGTVRVRPRTRALIVGGYALIHAASWLAMHIEARSAFRTSVEGVYSSGQTSSEVQRHGEVEPQTNPAEYDRNEMVVSFVKRCPRWSFASFAPAPMILVSIQSSIYGPLNGLGETCLYILGIDGIGCVLQMANWIS